jgi:RimJ/RimL family protein N-acetyltransferase
MRLASVTPWQTPELSLRAFHEFDICEDYLRTLNDASYMQFSRQRLRAHDRETVREYLSEVHRSGGAMVASFSRRTDKLVATTTMRPNSRKGAVEMGLLTLGSCRESGFGGATWLACIDYLRTREPDVHIIVAGTHQDNSAMQRILLTSGFAHVLDQTGKNSTEGLNMYFELGLRSRGAIDEVVT